MNLFQLLVDDVIKVFSKLSTKGWKEDVDAWGCVGDSEKSFEMVWKLFLQFYSL